VNERIDLIDLAFQAQDREIAERRLQQLMRDYDASWLLVAGGEVVPPIGSELDPYDARGVRELLASGDIDATLVASGPGRLPSNVEDEERAACDLQLWRLGEDRGGTGS
jgi:hypothetical protein